MKKRSFADGGMPNATFIRPGFSATRTGGRTELTSQQEDLAAKNKAAFEALMAAKSQFAPLSPERLHYQAYLGAEREKMRGLSGVRGTPVGAYTPGTYDPKATYGSRSLVPGMKKGGAVKVKKMADGGMSETTSTPPVLKGRALRAAEDPAFAKQLANEAAYSQVQAGRRQFQFPIGSPQAQNYRAFMQMEEDKYRALQGRGNTATGTYTAGTYDPVTPYTKLLSQQRAAADAAKKAAMPVKRAKGGMTSSVSKRGDGIAQRGKTKCKMR